MVTPKQQILDIAMNLHRVAGWAIDDFDNKQKRISLFLNQTNEYIQTLEQVVLQPKFSSTYHSFTKKFHQLKIEAEKKPANVEAWAESLMTWGNILTHRAKFLE